MVDGLFMAKQLFSESVVDDLKKKFSVDTLTFYSFLDYTNKYDVEE